MLSKRAVNFFKAHIVMFGLALLVGLITVAPSLLGMYALGDDYQGVPFLYQSDEEVYLSRIQDVLDGHPMVGSPVLYEYKDAPSPILPLGEYAYVLMALLSGASILSILIFSKFLFPFLLFIFAYFLIYQLTEGGSSRSRKYNSIAGALLVVLGYDFVHFSNAIRLIFGDNSFNLSIWTRTVNPTTGAVLLFLFLNLALRYVKSGKKIFIPLTALVGALMIGYVFSFAIVLAFSGLLLTLFLYQKDFKRARGFCLILLVAIISFLLQIFIAKQYPVASDITALTKNGLLYTHQPLFNKSMLLASSLFAGASYFYFRKKVPLKLLLKEGMYTWWVWICGFFFTLFICYNQQLITGRTIWPPHFVQYSIPLVFVAFSVFTYHTTRLIFPLLWKIMIVLIFISTISYGLWSDTTFKARLDNYREAQRYAPLYSWLNTNAPTDCVVFPVEMTDNLSTKLPAFTHCNVYYSIYTYFGVPQDRIEYSYLALLRLRGIEPEKLEDYFKNHDVEMRVVAFENWKQLLRHDNDPWIRGISNDQEIDDWIKYTRARLTLEYREFLKGDFKDQLQKYRIDYIVWDREKFPTWSPEKFPFLKEIGNSNGVVTYVIK